MMSKISNLPRELIDWVFHYSPSVTAVNATLALDLEPWDNDDQLGALYRAIFKTDQWLIQITEELDANLLELGQR